MPKNFPRAERVEELARQVLGEAIQELKDPRVGFVTVTSVRLSPDLRHAMVYISALGSPEEREETIGAVQHATPYLRSILGREVNMRFIPQLEISEDKTAEQGERIEMLLRQAGVAKAPEASSGVEGDEQSEGDSDNERPNA